MDFNTLCDIDQLYMTLRPDSDYKEWLMWDSIARSIEQVVRIYGEEDHIVLEFKSIMMAIRLAWDHDEHTRANIGRELHSRISTVGSNVWFSGGASDTRDPRWMLLTKLRKCLHEHFIMMNCIDLYSINI